MRIFFWLCVALLCVSVCVPAKAQKLLAARLDPLFNAPALHGGIVGVQIVDAGTGKVLYAKNADTRLLPASNAKLFTAAAALELLGENYTWTTRVVSQQKPDADGVVNGDVWLVGSGDASLTTPDLDNLAKQITAGGVTRIAGNVYGDNSLFTDGPYGFGWEWDDFSDEEFPQISALTVDDGDLTVVVKAGDKIGDPVQVSGEVSAISWQANAVTKAFGTIDDLSVARPLGRDIVEVTGSLPLGSAVTRHIPLSDPALFTVARLYDAMAGRRISLRGSPRDLSGLEVFTNGTSAPPRPADVTQVLATHTSAPLSAYVTHMLKESDNLYAECLVRTVGVQKSTAGTFQAGLSAEMPAFKTLGVDMTGVALVDGCGVGRRNYVTARAVCQLLVGMRHSPHWKTFYNALPVAGVDGTLKSRMKGTPAANNCHAKTGTLGAVRCLSGYVTGRSGRVYAFSVLLNNFPGTARQAGAVQDAVVETLAGQG